MSRLPTPGGDNDTWGTILNDYLGVEHNADGTQKTLDITKGGTGATSAPAALSNLNAVSNNDVRLSDERTPSDGSVTDAKIASPGLTNAAISASANIAKTKIQMPTASDVGAVGADGWISDSAETWTYASATSFVVAGTDVTAKYTPGTRIKLTQLSAVNYFVVASASFSTDTTVNITGGSDYTLANAAISANYHSYSANPQGYPTWFNYPPNVVGDTADTSIAQFAVNGRICLVNIVLQGTSTATTKSFSLPIAANVPTVTPIIQGGLQCRDNGLTQSSPAEVNVTSGTTATLFKALGTVSWTASSTWFCRGQFWYPI